jgi:succinate-semialdehyde dehydrogenase/glutarate-semialdehyde dehydrogenase
MADISAVTRKMMYGGRWVDAADGRTFDSLNPANGTVVARVPAGGAVDAKCAIDAADAAFQPWSRRTAAARALVLHRVAERLEARRAEVEAEITREEGKPLIESEGEVQLSIDSLHWYAEEARRAYGTWIPDPVANRRLLTMRGPVGVCGAIIPWNVPVAMIMRKAAPALAAGCTMVLKPAEQTPAVALLIAEIFLEADLPAGVFNVVTGEPAAIGQALLSDARVRKMSFTGSTDVGRILARGSAEHIKRISLELGGNAPVMLFDDCDIDEALDAVARLKFLNAGQACVGANRIYVQNGIYDAVAERLTAYASGLKVGNGVDRAVRMGPLIEQGAVDKVASLVADARAKGASLLTGGERLTGGSYDAGWFYAPTVLGGVTHTARAAHEEIFGPVAALYRFNDEEEVIRLANSSPYGLAAYVFTENLDRGIRVSERLETGMVGLNNIRLGAAEAPFGGVKQSGLGREGGREGLDEYLETKLVAMRVSG